MTGFLLWCILLVLCWPLALLAVLLYPIVWILSESSESPSGARWTFSGP